MGVGPFGAHFRYQQGTATGRFERTRSCVMSGRVLPHNGPAVGAHNRDTNVAFNVTRVYKLALPVYVF